MEDTKHVEQENSGKTASIEDKLDISSLSDFELAGIVCNRHFIKKINGELHSFNGKCYEQLGSVHIRASTIRAK